MFSVARFDPDAPQQDHADKANGIDKLLKRKRVGSASSQSVADLPAEAIATLDGATQTDGVEADSAVRKAPKRVKEKRQVIVHDEDDIVDQSKVAHILDRFHQYQRPANADAESVEHDDRPDENREHAKGLVAIPQPAGRRGGQYGKTASGSLATASYIQNAVTVDPAVRRPFSELALSAALLGNLARQDITEAFAVQAAVLPVLLAHTLPENRRDMLVSAPTGSGKTLAYVLPILQALQSRRITRLRAIVLVPTRELVAQVHATFEICSKKLGLSILATSLNRSLAAESDLLVQEDDNLVLSKVDVLIATPGRLIDHLKSTAGFTLEYLDFLVIDEGDRLLNQSFQGWAKELDVALRPLIGAEEQAELASAEDFFYLKSHRRCIKLIFSATMTDDPALLSELRLVDPQFFVVTEQLDEADAAATSTTHFSIPSTMSEIYVHCPADTPKPLALLHVLRRLDVGQSLIFTNSNEAAQKLSRLASLLGVGEVASFTSTMSNGERKRRLKSFAEAKIRHLVCSDLMARGIDTTTDWVINYDSSVAARQYIHRAGRTARAGRTGTAVSIVESSEDKYWWNQIGGKKIRRVTPVVRRTLFLKTQVMQQDVGEDAESASEGLLDEEDTRDAIVAASLKEIYEGAIATLQSATRNAS